MWISPFLCVRRGFLKKSPSADLPCGKRRGGAFLKAAPARGRQPDYLADLAASAAVLSACFLAANFARNFSTRPASTMRVWAPV